MTRLQLIPGRRRRRAAPPLVAFGPPPPSTGIVDLRRRREQLSARVAELQWDLGGLAYEMAIRNSIRADLIVQRAAVLQAADAELREVERILIADETGTSGACANCGAPHSNGAVYCWQCGSALLPQVTSDTIVAPPNLGALGG